MSAQKPGESLSVAELLAHAQVLERESAERYQELADSMEVHNNSAVAALFQQLARHGEARARNVAGRAAGVELPQVPPWEYRWLHVEGPGVPMEDVHYLMTVYQALELALHNERRSREFYLRCTGEGGHPEVGKMAGELAAEKEREVALLRDRLAREAPVHAPPPEDLDPPNMPE
jgi:rubrerythrin